MNRNIKNILMVLCTVFGVGILFDNANAAIDCSTSEYACAKCVYSLPESGSDWRIIYTIKSNGDGTLEMEQTNENHPGVEIKNNINDPDYFRDFDTNRLTCSDVYRKVGMSGGLTQYALETTSSNTSTKLSLISSRSTNNNKEVVSSSITDYNSCDFTDTATTKTNATCTVTYGNGKVTDINCGSYPYLWSRSNLDGVDFSQSCSNIKLYMYCKNTGNDNYCFLSNTESSVDGVTGSGTGSSDAEYTCNYKGQINGQSLVIEKYSDEWKINFPTGTTKTVSATKVGSNLFPSSNCEDVFLSTDKIIRSVTAGTTYTNTYVAQFCGMDEDTEQFCANGVCKIEDPICGQANDSEYGECPSEIRPIIWFIKKLVFNTVQLLIPIVLILMGTIDFAKAVMSSDDKANKDSIAKFVKRIIAAVAVFFVTTIVSIVMGMFAKTDVGAQNDWKACWQDID